jgi:hypothetical protein
VSGWVRKTLIAVACVAFAAFALLAIVFVFALSGYGSEGSRTDISQQTDVSHQKPYADFIGRDCRVLEGVSAYAWNDFPDKDKIIAVSLVPPPGVSNRFVTSETPLQKGQRIRIIGATRPSFFFGAINNYDYVVSIPDTELPNGVDVQLTTASDGIPDGRICELIAD